MDSSQHSYQGKVDKVFGNPLIVKRICSYFIKSRRDGLSLRLVNRLFQEEASKILRDHRHDLYSVVFNQKEKTKNFLDCMKIRHKFGLSLSPSFPFSSFKFGYQNPDSDMILEFCKMSNGQIRSLHFNIVESTIDMVLTLLSHSEKLVEIQYTTSAPRISPEELSHLPNQFKDLRVLSISYVSVEDKDSLSEFLLQRARRLERISCPVFSNSPDMRILRILSETHCNNPAVLSFQKQICIHPDDIPMIEELMTMSLRLSQLNISLSYWYRNTFTRAHRVEIADMKRIASDWLRTHSSALTSLEVDHYRGCTLRLPPLETLQKMTCQTLNSIENLDQARFPCLKKLSIRDERNGLNIQSPMGSVETIELYCTRITNQYLNFPNLTYLEIIFRYDSNEEDIISSIGIILTNCPLLVHLSIVKYERACLWNVLTGSAPRPPTNSHQFETGSSSAIVVENTHEDQIPSLRNLKALKTLEMIQISVGTLDAILYMTCTRQLVPLDKLTLEICGKTLPQGRDQACNHRRLARIHKDVKLKFIEDCVQSRTHSIIPRTRL